mmetsp:Transcript_3796/g.6380  ORF Transcript_3796/g.6380 Transcript_3796/m.6380 type:complete len:87 (-) Transcript_3796:67-327(-)
MTAAAAKVDAPPTANPLASAEEFWLACISEIEFVSDLVLGPSVGVGRTALEGWKAVAGQARAARLATATAGLDIAAAGKRKFELYN